MDDFITSVVTSLPASMPPMNILLAAISVYFAREFSRLSESIQDLNRNVAVLIERTTAQSHKIDRMDERVTFLETR